VLVNPSIEGSGIDVATFELYLNGSIPLFLAEVNCPHPQPCLVALSCRFFIRGEPPNKNAAKPSLRDAARTGNPTARAHRFSLREKGAGFKVPLPQGEGFRVRVKKWDTLDLSRI